MKYLQKTILIMLFGFSSLLLGNKAVAQETGAVPLMNVIKFNPIALVGETITFGYERVLNKKLSVEVTGNFTYTGPNNYFINGNASANGSSSPVKGWGIVPELRYYPLHSKYALPEGFFIGPFFRYQELMEEYVPYWTGNPETETMTRITIGGELGYQWLIDKKVCIEIFGGPAFEMVNNNVEGNVLLVGAGDQVGARLGFTIGLAF